MNKKKLQNEAKRCNRLLLLLSNNNNKNNIQDKIVSFTEKNYKSKFYEKCKYCNNKPTKNGN